MIVECSYCEAKVNGKVLAQHDDPQGSEDLQPSFRTTFLTCPVCDNALLAGQMEIGAEWDTAARLWPSPEPYVSRLIPEVVRASLEEADRCSKAKAYAACAVMCGRSLEGIAHHYSITKPNLFESLKELETLGVINGRLLLWAEELRKSRNIGAHATGEKVSKQDASDLLDFTSAICEYVFVLNAKFDVFMKRRTSKGDKTE